MAITTTDLSIIYDEFLTKGLDNLKSLQKETQMEDEQIAAASASIIAAAMRESIGALEVLKRIEILDLQKVTETNKALDIASSTAVRDAQSDQDLKNKAAQKILIDNQVLKLQKDTAFVDAQKVTETNKALDIASSTAVRDAQSAQDLKNKAAQKILIDNQVLKLQKDTAFVDEQRTQLGLSVTYNNKIKSLNSYGNMIGTMGAGGLVISSDMWSAFFNMVKGLNVDVSANPTDTTIVKA